MILFILYRCLYKKILRFSRPVGKKYKEAHKEDKNLVWIKKRWVCVLTLVGRNTVILFFYSAYLKVNTFLNCLHIFPYIYLLIKILWLLCLLVFLWRVFKGTLAILFIASPQFNFAFHFYKNIYTKKGSFALLLYFAPFCTEEKWTPI